MLFTDCYYSMYCELFYGEHNQFRISEIKVLVVKVVFETVDTHAPVNCLVKVSLLGATKS